jgi:hypothetical protein
VPNDGTGDWVTLAASAVPQSPQKPLLRGFSAPHFGQWLANGAPQSAQNFLPAGLSLPHFEQRVIIHQVFVSSRRPLSLMRSPFSCLPILKVLLEAAVSETTARKRT